MIRKLLAGAGALGASMFAALPAWAAAPAEAAAAVPNPGNNAWMMTSTVLVLMMILPGLALFYGGLTRSKNMIATMPPPGRWSGPPGPQTSRRQRAPLSPG